MVNFTPYDTYGRSSRRQAGYITAERASRAAAADKRRREAAGDAKVPTLPRVAVAWSFTRKEDRATHCSAYINGTERAGRVFVEGGRLFAQVTYPEPGNTASVILAGSFDQTPAGCQQAKRAVEDALAAHAADRRAAAAILSA